MLVSCNPVTKRPDFQPFPQAQTVVLMARPQLVIPFLATIVQAESLRVTRSSPRDGYLETDWYDTATRRSYRGGRVPDLGRSVKLRAWADPYVPGETMFTLEVTYRPRYDPSRTERDLETPVGKDHEGEKLATALLGKLKERFGSP